jgi:Uma2 family endonuclease
MDAILLEDSKGRKMSDEEFERFCQDNPDLRIERNSNLEISIMSPNTPLSGNYGAQVTHQLFQWNEIDRKGVVFDASAGFTLPDDSILSPDASWMSNEKWNNLPLDEKEKFSHVCPEFVIEVRPKSDSLRELKLKMETWIKNKAELAWLIDPRRKTCWIYSQDLSVREVAPSDLILRGEGPLNGFNLNLGSIF